MGTMGRPLTFDDELQAKAWEYVDNFADHDHAIPSLVGLCKVLNRAKSTIYDWAKRDDNDFSDILQAINENQELVIFNKALSGEYNAAIAKLALGKHGYHDKMDVQATEIPHEDWLKDLDD
jgi:hypothetical protein